MDQLEFCRIECERQQTDLVEEMMWALDEAQHNQSIYGGQPTKFDILYLAAVIEPERNKLGFRKQPATFKNGPPAVDARQIPRLIEQLLDNWEDMTPQEVFQESARIHGFQDGNGRLSQILFNWRAGTLHDPEFAAEYKHA